MNSLPIGPRSSPLLTSLMLSQQTFRLKITFPAESCGYELIISAENNTSLILDQRTLTDSEDGVINPDLYVLPYCIMKVDSRPSLIRLRNRERAAIEEMVRFEPAPNLNWPLMVAEAMMIGCAAYASWLSPASMHLSTILLNFVTLVEVIRAVTGWLQDD